MLFLILTIKLFVYYLYSLFILHIVTTIAWLAFLLPTSVAHLPDISVRTAFWRTLYPVFLINTWPIRSFPTVSHIQPKGVITLEFWSLLLPLKTQACCLIFQVTHCGTPQSLLNIVLQSTRCSSPGTATTVASLFDRRVELCMMVCLRSFPLLSFSFTAKKKKNETDGKQSILFYSHFVDSKVFQTRSWA